MILTIQDDPPPRDKEIYIVVLRKAFFHKTDKDGIVIWNPMNDELPIGYLLPKDVPEFIHANN
jgi:hypothetical protein